MKKTLVLGASPNPERYSNKAVKSLLTHGHAVMAVGSKTGSIENTPILIEIAENQEIDTVSIYLNPQNQESWKTRILGLKPRRVIFNPGTENGDFAFELNQNGIATEESCTLVLLSTNQF